MKDCNSVEQISDFYTYLADSARKLTAMGKALVDAANEETAMTIEQQFMEDMGMDLIGMAEKINLTQAAICNACGMMEVRQRLTISERG